MTGRSDFLVEIGTEELPPKALRGLIDAFARAIASELADARLSYDALRPFASPRRLAVLVSGLLESQEDQEVELKGPPVSVALRCMTSSSDGGRWSISLAFSA